MSHLVWVLMGVRIIRLAVKPFFDREKVTCLFCLVWGGFWFGLVFGFGVLFLFGLVLV